MSLKSTFVGLTFVALMLACAPAVSQELTELDPASVTEFDDALATIERQKDTIQDLEERVKTFDGPAADLLNVRTDKLLTSTFHAIVRLATDVDRARSKGQDVSAYQDQVVAELASLPAAAHDAIDRLSTRIEFPTDTLSVDQFVIRDQELFKSIQHVDHAYQAMIDYYAIAEAYGIDIAEDIESTRTSIADAAANRSVFLELAIDSVETLRAASYTLPDDTSIANWLKAAQSRVKNTADVMNTSIQMMNDLDLPTQSYRQQVLTATGEITSDVLDVGIVGNLIGTWSASLFELIANDGPQFLFQILLVILILFVFRQLSKLSRRGVEAALKSARVSVSLLLGRMIVSAVGNLVFFVGVLVAVSQLGISLGPLFAGLGIAGFIIGFALQDALGNFASGLMILFYRPFDVGDEIEASNVSGKVSQMSLVNTTINTFDNQKMVVPNNLIWQSVITNRTAQRTRRVDLMFGIAYDDDIEKAEKVLIDIISNTEGVLEDPAPSVKLHELAESSVNFIVRPWVKTKDYWPTYWHVTRQVKVRFDQEGITIPFPQRDVHVHEGP